MSTRYTQADLDALNQAIALGVTRATYNGQTVEYRDLAAMKAIRDEMEAELGIKVTKRRSKAVFKGGY